MEKFEHLLQHIEHSVAYRKILLLKDKIESNPEYFETYQNIIALQKKLVALEAKEDRLNSEPARKEYFAQLDRLSQDIIVNEYLNDLDEFNTLIHEIEKIINISLN